MGERRNLDGGGTTDEADCDCSLDGDTLGAVVLLGARLKGVGLLEFPEVVLRVFLSLLLGLLFAAIVVGIGGAFTAALAADDSSVALPETGIGMPSGDGWLSGAAVVFGFSTDGAVVPIACSAGAAVTSVVDV